MAVRALGYLRVSTDEQARSGLGLAAQRITVTTEADKRGFEVVGWRVDDGVSGTVAPEKRPALSAALQVLAAGDAERLVVAKLDRLSRSTMSALVLDATARREGWSIVFGDLDIDTATAAGQLVLSNFAALAQFERDRISERTREALAVKKAQGVRLGRPASVSTDVIARIISEREAGLTLRAIAEHLNHDHIPTAHGGRRWYASTVKAVFDSQDASALRWDPQRSGEIPEPPAQWRRGDDGQFYRLTSKSE
ncbi:MAG: recombinase family protein [Gordonia polyisoprenivorans]|nr:recombinase family protein [Gordonia polyisoprenivorans]